MRVLCKAVVALVALASVSTVFAQDPPASSKKDYPNCATSIYYQDLSTNPAAWNREELENLVEKTHGDPLSIEGVFEALIELDQAPNEPGSVQLIYSGKSMPAGGYNAQDTWTREHLWADSRGAVGSFAFTDIHNSRPESTRVTMIKREMTFGECGTVEFADVCEKPAFTLGPADTSQDGKVWMPPLDVRGDIARALFYMELRYGTTDLDLKIVDCPPFAGRMSYLSQLLEWHAADPVSDPELIRNTNACTDWQGNRNPFVDFPELVTRFFGEPQTIEQGTRTYPSCLNIPTPAPTAELNACAELQAGDIFIYVVEADDPDGVGFMALEDLPAGLELYMTDNPWTGTGFAAVEGTVKLTIPSAGIKSGERFGFGFDFGAEQKWLRESGTFNIGIMGDSVFLYCYLGDSTVNHLVAYSNNNAWAPAGLPVGDYGSEKSALPDELREVGSVILPHLDNYRYEGPGAGEKIDLQNFMMDPNNWSGNDEGLGDQGGSGGAIVGRFTALATLAVLALATSLAYVTYF